MGVVFTDAEYLILSSLAYSNKLSSNKFDENGYPIKGSEIELSSLFGSLRKLACSDNEELENLLTKDGEWKEKADSYSGQYKDYKDAIDSLIEKLESHNFKISKCVNKNTADDTGFLTLAIEPEPNTDNQVFICCRGSDKMTEENKNDWVDADIALLAEETTDQQADMAEFMVGMEKYDEINITGHSLGGNLAIYGAISMNCPELINKVYSFDGPGFNDAFIAVYSDQIEALEGKISNFQNEEDIISSALNSVGEIKVVNSHGTGTFGLGHDRWLFDVNDDGSFNYVSHKTGRCYVAHEVIDRLSRKWNLSLVGGVDYLKPQSLYSNETHDFSDANKNEMIQIINSVDGAEFTSLEDWRQFSSCGWFINAAANVAKQKIEEYYEALSKANQKCKSKINTLFDTMSEIENNTAITFEDIVTNLQQIKTSLENDFIYRIRVK